MAIHNSVSAFLYLLGVSTSFHELGDRHAACALPFVGGWRCGRGSLGCSGRVSLRACGCVGFFAGLFSSSCSEVGPLAGHRKSLLTQTGQDLCVHIPAAASVCWALLIHSIVLYEALHLYSDEGRFKFFLFFFLKREREILGGIVTVSQSINSDYYYYILTLICCCSFFQLTFSHTSPLTIVPGGNVFCLALRTGKLRRWWRGRGGSLLSTKLLKLSDDHFAAIYIAMKQRQQLTKYWKRQECIISSNIKELSYFVTNCKWLIPL